MRKVFILGAIISTLVLGWFLWSKFWNLSSAGSVLGTVDTEGIRSDVREFVKKYPSEGVRKAALQVHKNLQEAILDPDHWDQEASLQAEDCLAYQVGDSNEYIRISREIEAITANTYERLTSYLKADAKNRPAFLRGVRQDPKACK